MTDIWKHILSEYVNIYWSILKGILADICKIIFIFRPIYVLFLNFIFKIRTSHEESDVGDRAMLVTHVGDIFGYVGDKSCWWHPACWWHPVCWWQSMLVTPSMLVTFGILVTFHGMLLIICTNIHQNTPKYAKIHQYASKSKKYTKKYTTIHQNISKNTKMHKIQGPKLDHDIKILGQTQTTRSIPKHPVFLPNHPVLYTKAPGLLPNHPVLKKHQSTRLLSQSTRFFTPNHPVHQSTRFRFC